MVSCRCNCRAGKAIVGSSLFLSFSLSLSLSLSPSLSCSPCPRSGRTCLSGYPSLNRGACTGGRTFCFCSPRTPERGRGEEAEEGE